MGQLPKPTADTMHPVRPNARRSIGAPFVVCDGTKPSGVMEEVEWP
jgi:hypothetical protein